MVPLMPNIWFPTKKSFIFLLAAVIITGLVAACASPSTETCIEAKEKRFEQMIAPGVPEFTFEVMLESAGGFLQIWDPNGVPVATTSDYPGAVLGEDGSVHISNPIPGQWNAQVSNATICWETASPFRVAAPPPPAPIIPVPQENEAVPAVTGGSPSDQPHEISGDVPVDNGASTSPTGSSPSPVRDEVAPPDPEEPSSGSVLERILALDGWFIPFLIAAALAIVGWGRSLPLSPSMFAADRLPWIGRDRAAEPPDFTTIEQSSTTFLDAPGGIFELSGARAFLDHDGRPVAGKLTAAVTLEPLAAGGWAVAEAPEGVTVAGIDWRDMTMVSLAHGDTLDINGVLIRVEQPIVDAPVDDLVFSGRS